MTVYFHLRPWLRILLYSMLWCGVSIVVMTHLQGVLLWCAIALLITSLIGFVVVKSHLSALKWDDKDISLYLNGQWQPFWVVKRKIVIRNWVYLHLHNDAGHHDYRVWLHRSYLKDPSQWHGFCREVLNKG